MTTPGQNTVRPTDQTQQITGLIPVGRDKYHKDKPAPKQRKKRRREQQEDTDPPTPEAAEAQPGDTSTDKTNETKKDHKVDYLA